MPDRSVYLYAVTEPNTYTIYFDGNGSTAWSMGSMSMTYDREANLLANGYTKEWFEFKWWSSSKTGEVEYQDQSEVKNLTAEDWGEVVLYAKREGEISYIIEYCQENVGWTWCDVVGTGVGYTTADSVVVLTWKTYTWFTLRTGDVVSVNPDWSTVVQYVYKRNTYNLVVKDRDNVLIDTWIKYGADIVLPEDPTWWTGNTFSGWYSWDVQYTTGSKMPAEDVVITSVWIYGVHSITFDTDWWTEVEPIVVNYGETIETPENPTKTWYEFVGWEPGLPSTMPYDDITVKAIWKEINNKWWWGWWWWRRVSIDEPGWEDEHGSAPSTNKPRRGMEDLDAFFAYMWAHDMWIIDTSWKDSDPDGYVTRWAMAEMVVKFTEIILWREIPKEIPAKCRWWDASWEWKTEQTKVYAEKACALGVMWIRMQNFMPNKILDRAEFGTILSRLLWWDKYDVVDATATKLYYTRHLDALNREKIMTQIENPESRKELRKWAWLMLMRVKL